MRIDSAEVAGCRVFREALATADIPREYEDGDQPGTLLMTLNIPDRSQRDVHAFLHLLIGTDESKAITDFASLSTVRCRQAVRPFGPSRWLSADCMRVPSSASLPPGPPVRDRLGRAVDPRGRD